LAPPFTKSLVVSAPLPLAAPVTIAVLPWNSMLSSRPIVRLSNARF
jgi:hypothetical protein